jgi:hypothetical protein
MSRVASFDEFRNDLKDNHQWDESALPEASNENVGYYMFFRNLMSMKHYIDEILQMDPAKVEAMLKDGHDWASDHITSAKDDVAEVAEWIRTEAEMLGDNEGEEYEDDEVEYEDEDEDEDDESEEEESEDEEEEEESYEEE